MSMDDFERELRDRLHDADGWQPRSRDLGAVAADGRRTPRALVVTLVVLLAVIVASGATFALTRGRGTGPVSLAQQPVATGSVSPTPSPSPAPTSTGFADCGPGSLDPSLRCAPSAASTPDAPVELPSADPSALSLPPAVTNVVPTRSATPSGSPSPRRTVFTLPPQCTASQLKLTVATDKTSYLQAAPIAIDVHAVASASCEASEPEVDIQGSGSTFVWSTCHGVAPDENAKDASCNSSLGIYDLHPGETKGAHYSWDMQTGPATDGEPPTYLAAGDYTVRYSFGSVTATTKVTVTDAPACTASDLAASISTDKSIYAHGETATISVRRENSSAPVCDLPYGPISTPATDASGTQVWSGCYETGLPKGIPYCSYNSPANPQPTVLTPGATFLSQVSWDLDHDGTKDTDPGPVPDGTYTLSFTLDGAAPVTTQIAVTG